MTLVSRARVDGPAGTADFRAAAGGGVADAADAWRAAAAFPAAFRFFEVPVVVGVDALESLADATLPALPLTAWKDVASGARFASETCAVLVDASFAFFLPVVAADEYSNSMSWSSA